MHFAIKRFTLLDRLHKLPLSHAELFGAKSSGGLCAGEAPEQEHQRPAVAPIRQTFTAGFL